MLLNSKSLFMISIKSISKLRKNRKGGIEGLPLQLMIVILVATLGTAILVGWMSSIEAPSQIGSVDVEPNNIILGKTSGNERYADAVSVKVYVMDQNGAPLQGATVVLTGCNVTKVGAAAGATAYGVTDAKGYVDINNLKVSLRDQKIGFITVEVSKPGYGTDSTARIPVIV